MILQGLSFKPKLWSLIVTIGFVYIFVTLGNWQLSRADEKNSRQAQLTHLAKQPAVTIPGSLAKLEDFEYRKVEVRGEYLPAYTIFLDNQTHQGTAGYHVITPIKLANSSLHVLINRGWVATGFDRAVLPEIPEVRGEVIVSGTAVSPEKRTLQLSDQLVAGSVWENLNIQRYEETTGLKLQPLLVLQEDKLQDGLIREWKSPDSGADRNLGYAFQWFSLAATAVIIFLVLNVKRKRSEIE